MDTEFHYYMTGIIAKAAGFSNDEAKTIATASEYVDENDVCLKIEDRSGGEVYENYISQTMNILKPKRRLMRIYPVFHFVPGDPMDDGACRTDGKMHLLNTTPGNEIADNLINAAFKSPEDVRLYRIGIATHAFADTWAHQNFVGWYDYFNNIGMDPKPDIGHADAEHHPDWPAHRWEDERLVENEIDNTERYINAAENIYNKYRGYLELVNRNADTGWDDLCSQLIAAMGSSFSGNSNCYSEERISRYNKIAPWPGEFDEAEWFDAAIETKVRGLKDSDKGLLSMFTMLRDKLYWRDGVDREKTDWFRFQESVKEHQRFAMGSLDKLFKKMDMNLHVL